MKVEKEYLVEQKYRIHGFNDDICNCDVCGRTELKGTYIMESLATGEIFRAGSSCGARMAGWTTKQLVATYKAGEKEKLEKAKQEFWDSAENKAMNQAYDFLNKERDEIESKIARVWYDKEKVEELENMKRSWQSGREYLRPFSEALEAKRAELKLKYNLSEKTYLC